MGMEKKGYAYYGERITSLAVDNPNVDMEDEEDLESFVRDRADELCLDAEPLVKYVIETNPVKTRDPVFDSSDRLSTSPAFQ